MIAATLTLAVEPEGAWPDDAHRITLTINGRTEPLGGRLINDWRTRARVSHAAICEGPWYTDKHGLYWRRREDAQAALTRAQVKLDEMTAEKGSEDQ